MSGIPMNAAWSIIKAGIGELGKVVPNTSQAQGVASGMILSQLGEVQKRLERLQAAGYKLERIRSTLLLCNEAINRQKEIQALQGNQHARLLQLKAGLGELL